MREEHLAALLAGQHGGLTGVLIERLIAALERPRDLAGSLHELTDEQSLFVEAFRRTAGAMSVPGFVSALRGVIRKGRVVAVPVPRTATCARVFLRSGVLEVPVEGGAAQFWLPECVEPTDHIARIEFLSARGRLLEATGGEVRPGHEHGECVPLARAE